MSKQKTAGPSAPADVAGASNPDASAVGVASDSNPAANQDGQQAPGQDGAADLGAEAAAAKVLPVGVLDWATSLEYPVVTTLRNNGHVTVVEPETAQIIGGGGAVSVTLFDEGHAVRVLDNTVQLNALHFQGDLKVRLDVAPDELYLKG